MIKKILPICLLTFGVHGVAQDVLAFVGAGAQVYVKEKALFFSGGTLSSEGLFQTEGNVRLKDGGLRTKMNDGKNFVLKMNSMSTPFTSYGQLWIDNNRQSDITGTLTKEYMESSHGEYQQLALPFMGKLVSELNTEIKGLNLTNDRFRNRKATGTNLLVYDNTTVQTHLVRLNEKLGQSGTISTGYYILGTKNLAKQYLEKNISNIKGVPYASGVRSVMQNAGKDVNFGANGENLNSYKQKYNTYVTDAWSASKAVWSGDYGRNIYQYGNPYFVNLDLSKIPDDLRPNDDFTEGILGIRFEVSNTSTNLAKLGTGETKYRYIGYYPVDGKQEAIVGDVGAVIVKPMQAIAVKLASNSKPLTIDFDKLRTFSSEAEEKGVKVFEPHSLSKFRREKDFVAYSFDNRKVVKSKTFKQLGVIALDKEQREIGRTYYAVHPDLVTGRPLDKSVQIANMHPTVIGTFEENRDGGRDGEAQLSYWLYVNEANENDFKGKGIIAGLYSSKIKFLKFEIREQGKLISDNTSELSTGDSFYVRKGDIIKEAKQGDVIPVDVSDKGTMLTLFYGKPQQELSTTETLSKPSETYVVLDASDDNYKVMFDKTWKSASVSIYDTMGRLIMNRKGVDTSIPFVLSFPSGVKAEYIVVSESEKGVKYRQKVVK